MEFRSVTNFLEPKQEPAHVWRVWHRFSEVQLLHEYVSDDKNSHKLRHNPYNSPSTVYELNVWLADTIT